MIDGAPLGNFVRSILVNELIAALGPLLLLPEDGEKLMGYPTGWTDLKDSETP